MTPVRKHKVEIPSIHANPVAPDVVEGEQILHEYMIPQLRRMYVSGQVPSTYGDLEAVITEHGKTVAYPFDLVKLRKVREDLKYDGKADHYVYTQHAPPHAQTVAARKASLLIETMEARSTCDNEFRKNALGEREPVKKMELQQTASGIWRFAAYLKAAPVEQSQVSSADTEPTLLTHDAKHQELLNHLLKLPAQVQEMYHNEYHSWLDPLFRALSRHEKYIWEEIPGIYAVVPGTTSFEEKKPIGCLGPWEHVYYHIPLRHRAAQ